MGALTGKERVTVLVAVAATLVAGALNAFGSTPLVIFVVAAVGLAMLASIVGDATEQLGARLSPGATGVLQSALGNLPELFVAIFALRAGLVTVVQAALIGSILSNSLLVLGLALLFGGLRHGTQKFASDQPKMIATLMFLATAALTVPTLAQTLHTPAEAHEETLAVACALVLLAVFIASIPVSIQGGPTTVTKTPAASGEGHWPMGLTIGLLAGAGIAAAFVSDWFVAALTPAIQTLHISEAFAGLVVVAIAGNAVENVVGIQLALDNKPDYAISVILNSSLQVALALTPVLVLLSFVIGGAHLTLVLPPLLVAAVALATLASNFIVFDGESIWMEGVALVGLYVILAASFWWG